MKETFRVPIRVQIGQHSVTDAIKVEIDVAAELLEGNTALIKLGPLSTESDLIDAISSNDLSRLLRLLADKLDNARAEK
jgi:hypothetical protein